MCEESECLKCKVRELEEEVEQLTGERNYWKTRATFQERMLEAKTETMERLTRRINEHKCAS